MQFFFKLQCLAFAVSVALLGCKDNTAPQSGAASQKKATEGDKGNQSSGNQGGNGGGNNADGNGSKGGGASGSGSKASSSSSSGSGSKGSASSGSGSGSGSKSEASDNASTENSGECDICAREPVVLFSDSGSCELEVDFGGATFSEVKDGGFDCADVGSEDKEECEKEKKELSAGGGSKVCSVKVSFNAKSCTGGATKDKLQAASACPCSCKSMIQGLGKKSITVAVEAGGEKGGGEDKGGE